MKRGSYFSSIRSQSSGKAMKEVYLTSTTAVGSTHLKVKDKE